MTIDALIMLAGGAVALLPFLGFPVSWDSVISFLLGVLIIGLGVVVRRVQSHKRPMEMSRRQPQLFAENDPSVQAHDEVR